MATTRTTYKFIHADEFILQDSLDEMAAQGYVLHTILPPLNNVLNYKLIFELRERVYDESRLSPEELRFH